MYDRIENEPLPAVRGAGTDGHLLMRWPIWVEQIWRMNGTALLGREQDMIAWANQVGSRDFMTAAPELFTDMPNLHALFSDQKNMATIAYPRNASVAPVSKSGRHDVLLGDYNRYLRAMEHGRPIPKLFPATIAAASFPDRHPLVVTPTTPAQLGMWAQVAGDRTSVGIPDLEAKFDVYTREPVFAASVLTDEIIDRLLAHRDVRVFADHGRVVLASTNGWVPPTSLNDFVLTTALLSRSGLRALTA